VASPARFPGQAVKDGVFECFGGTLAPWAGGGDIAVPGWVGSEVALPRSHLVEAARRKLVEAHEGVRPKGGAERVSDRVWCGHVPFFHEEAFAFELELRVGAARGGRGVEVDEQVLGGDREGV